jgi:uncharacterized protein YjdB
MIIEVSGARRMPTRCPSVRLFLVLLQMALVAALGPGCGSPAGDSTTEEVVTTASSDIKAVTLKSIAVTPSPSTLYADTTESLTAIGTYSDGSTQNLTNTATWTSNNANVATVSASGLVTTIGNGTATITAQSGTVKGKATVKVSVTLTSIAVTPASTTLPAGTTQALSATGSYSNGKKKNLTSAVSWASSNTAVATVSSAGVIVTVAPGIATILASTSASANSPVVGSATITVSNATLTSLAVTPVTKNLPDGATQRFTATATFSDGTKETPVVSWGSSSPSTAMIDATGLATGTAPGTTTITATDVANGTSATAKLTVTAAKLVSVAVTPASANAIAGTTQQFTATGTYTDGSSADITNRVTWSSSSTAVATIASTGLATTVSAGGVTITATVPKNKKGTASLTVTPAVLQSIALGPPSPTVPAGLTSQLTATGTWTDGTTQDVTSTVTWSSSATAVATVSQGLVSALKQGTTTISVVDPTTQVTQSETLTVTPGVLVAISVSPSNPSLPVGTTTQLVATATYSDGSTANVTASAVWVSANEAIAVANTPGVAGQVTALGVGTAVVSATDPTTGLSGQTSVTATAAALVSIAVSPSNPSITVGAVQQFTATALLTDGTMHDVTATVSWSSSASSLSVSNATGTQGQATAVAAGSATLTATDPATGIGGSTLVTILAPTFAVNVPLQGCTDYGYWGPVTLGGNQTFELFMDPGSSTLAVAASNCPTCTGIAPLFTPSAPATDLGHTTSAEYGDGSSWSGEAYEDTVAPGGSASGSVSMAFAAITSQSSFFSQEPCGASQGSYEGILGLGPSDLTAPFTDAYMSKVTAAGVSDVFAFEMCPLGGQFWLGGFDASAATAPPSYMPMMSNGYYNVSLEDVQIGAYDYASAGGAPIAGIVDLGTTVTQLPVGVYNAIVGVLEGNPTFEALFPGTAFQGGSCETATAAQLAALPPLTMVFPSTTGGTFAIPLSAQQSYLTTVTQGSTTFYCPGIQGSEMPIFGVSTSWSQLIVFDVQNGRLGLAPHNACP